MERSLTVLLPVHNVQSSLVETVLEVLEIVAELTEQFELVIVDDGSADATSEVAQELIRCYPQVRAICHGQCLGRDAAIRTGLQHSSGQMILLRDETDGMAVDAIAKHWWAARLETARQETARQETARQETARQGSADDSRPAAPAVGKPTVGKWTRISAGHTARRPGYRLIDRTTMERLHGSSQPTRPNYLSRLRDFALGE